MKTLLLIIASLFIFTGCSHNTKNLTFQEHKTLRVTFDCHVPFDSVRKVESFQEKNTTKDEYYVEFQNIYESHFELTQTNVRDACFSITEYVDYLEEQGVEILYQKIQNGILYITYKKRNLVFNQIVSASWHNINIATAEPMMFKAIQNHCK